MAAARGIVSAGADDVVRIAPLSGPRATIRLRGTQAAATRCLDFVFRGNRITAGSVAGTQIPVGNFIPQVAVAPCPAQLVVFAIDSAFALIPNVAWTAMPGDVVNVEMRPPLKVPINLWVLQAPPPPEDPSVPANPDVRSQANGDAGQASLLYNTQTAGIVFLPNAKDMTASATPALLNGDCSTPGVLSQLKTAPHYIAGQLNVYYVNTISNSASMKGHSCPPPDTDTILISAPHATVETLAHEVGHAFSLVHTNVSDPITGENFDMPLPGFSGDNLMFGLGPNKWRITSGQVFRANLNVSSMLNKIGVRGGPMRNPACPDLSPSAGTGPSLICPDASLDLMPK